MDGVSREDDLLHNLVNRKLSIQGEVCSHLAAVRDPTGFYRIFLDRPVEGLWKLLDASSKCWIPFADLIEYGRNWCRLGRVERRKFGDVGMREGLGQQKEPVSSALSIEAERSEETDESEFVRLVHRPDLDMTIQA